VALINRQETFLAAPEWMSIPFEKHPKSLLDHLLDLMLALPALLVRCDSIAPLPPTLSRRHAAQELLTNCLVLERKFERWLTAASRGAVPGSCNYWTAEWPGANPVPFADPLRFQDGQTGLMFVYYWMSQILFHRCIETVHRTIYQAVLDAYPDVWPNLPLELQIDIYRYQQTRDLAAQICRSLDSVLEATVQPDLLVGPLTVAGDVYRTIHATSPDGVMELYWLEGFQARLTQQGQQISHVLQDRKWYEIANY
jgi:hypothetical protein